MVEWWNSLTTIEQIFGAIAIPATLILILQTILLMFSGIGEGGGEDVGIDVDGDGTPDYYVPDASGGDQAFDSGGVRLFTVYGIVAFLAIFGWSGMVMLRNGLNAVLSIILALVFGFIAMYLTAIAIRAFTKLQADGSLDIRNAVGSSGTVYLTIPAKRGGKGKIMALVSESLTEFEAVTDDENPIKTETHVDIIGLIGGNTLVVSADRQK